MSPERLYTFSGVITSETNFAAQTSLQWYLIRSHFEVLKRGGAASRREHSSLRLTRYCGYIVI